MKHVVKHDLDQATAKRAAEGAWQAYSERFSEFSPTATWTSDTHADIAFSVKGFSLKGELDLEPGAIAMDMDVPMLLRPFKKKAIEIIEREIRVWIGKAKAGEL